MRCAQFVGPCEIRLGRRPDVAAAGGSDAIVRIVSVGVCGSDMHLYRDGQIGHATIPIPFILGHEAMGVVEKVGSEADRDLVGRRVAIEPTIHCGRCECCQRGDPNLCVDHEFLGLPPRDGALQERICHPASLLEPIPDSVSDAEGVLLEPLAVALHALDLSDAKPGMTAAVLGCGTLGLSVLALLRRAGILHVFCTDRLPYRLKLARAMGAEHVAVAGGQSIREEANAASGGRGFPLVFDCAGTDESQRDMADIAAPGAKLMLIGTNTSGRIACDGHTTRRKGLTLYMVRRSRRTLPRALDLVASGSVSVGNLATHEFSLENAQEAFHTVHTYGDGVLKAIIRV